MKSEEQKLEEVFVGFAAIMMASGRAIETKDSRTDTGFRPIEDAEDCYDAAQSLWREHRKRYPEPEE